MNQEGLFDAIDQRVLDDDLRIRDAGAPRLDAPLDATRRERVFHGAIDRSHERRHGLRDCLADGRAEDWEDGGGNLTRVPTDRLPQRRLHRRRQRPANLPVALPAQDDRLGQVLGEIGGRDVPLPQLGGQFLEPVLLRSNQELAKRREISAPTRTRHPTPAVAAPRSAVSVGRCPGRRRGIVRHWSVLRLLLRRAVSVTRQAAHEVRQSR